MALLHARTNPAKAGSRPSSKLAKFKIRIRRGILVSCFSQLASYFSCDDSWAISRWDSCSHVHKFSCAAQSNCHLVHPGAGNGQSILVLYSADPLQAGDSRNPRKYSKYTKSTILESPGEILKNTQKVQHRGFGRVPEKYKKRQPETAKVVKYILKI